VRDGSLGPARRFLPIVAMAEVKSVMAQADAHRDEDDNGDNHDGGENQGKPAAAH